MGGGWFKLPTLRFHRLGDSPPDRENHLGGAPLNHILFLSLHDSARPRDSTPRTELDLSHDFFSIPGCKREGQLWMPTMGSQPYIVTVPHFGLRRTTSLRRWRRVEEKTRPCEFWLGTRHFSPLPDRLASSRSTFRKPVPVKIRRTQLARPLPLGSVFATCSE
ncbi:hypothetical protein IE53DRAFT_16135 [Violaceomyces palustris]|uniref:Uncharacterized protein n=1 Tax=Violaceomyces palustris TaxID=1673888 RepID=A0ACD0NLJ0_9BASI|nr:hypothetical protein IE53DRAFT_16135 [Violaceomyces palustris]